MALPLQGWSTSAGIPLREWWRGGARLEGRIWLSGEGGSSMHFCSLSPGWGNSSAGTHLPAGFTCCSHCSESQWGSVVYGLEVVGVKEPGKHPLCPSRPDLHSHSSHTSRPADAPHPHLPQIPPPNKILHPHPTPALFQTPPPIPSLLLRSTSRPDPALTPHPAPNFVNMGGWLVVCRKFWGDQDRAQAKKFVNHCLRGNEDIYIPTFTIYVLLLQFVDVS